MRIFFDANVLFSASNDESAISVLVANALKEHEGVTSDFALEEAKRNVQRKRPEWTDGLKSLRESLQIVPSVVFDLEDEIEDKDKPILCTAISDKCDLLVTGDKKHFGHLYGKTIDSVLVIPVRGLIDLLSSDEAS